MGKLSPCGSPFPGYLRPPIPSFPFLPLIGTPIPLLS